jgi:hypothetical protein
MRNVGILLRASLAEIPFVARLSTEALKRTAQSGRLAAGSSEERYELRGKHTCRAPSDLGCHRRVRGGCRPHSRSCLRPSKDDSAKLIAPARPVDRSGRRRRHASPAGAQHGLGSFGAAFFLHDVPCPSTPPGHQHRGGDLGPIPGPFQPVRRPLSDRSLPGRRPEVRGSSQSSYLCSTAEKEEGGRWLAGTPCSRLRRGRLSQRGRAHVRINARPRGQPSMAVCRATRGLASDHRPRAPREGHSPADVRGSSSSPSWPRHGWRSSPRRARGLRRFGPAESQFHAAGGCPPCCLPPVIARRRRGNRLI